MVDEIAPIDEELAELLEEDRAFWERPIMQEARAVSERVHELLGGVAKQFDGTYETERVHLELPKALVYLATYLGVRDAEETSEPSALWQSFLEGQAPEKITHLRDWYIEGLLRLELNHALHDLATGAHHLLHPEERERNKPPEEGREQVWQRRKAAGLLRLALMRMTDDADPPDMDEMARKARTDDVYALMDTACQLAGKRLKEEVEARDNPPQDDIPF